MYNGLRLDEIVRYYASEKILFGSDTQLLRERCAHNCVVGDEVEVNCIAHLVDETLPVFSGKLVSFDLGKFARQCLIPLSFMQGGVRAWRIEHHYFAIIAWVLHNLATYSYRGSVAANQL